MNTFKEYITACTSTINEALDQCVPSENARPSRLHQSMRHSLFAGGKRFRPALCIAVCEACGGTRDQALNAACALEILHTSTLIHDDLPAMDDDTLRRGIPTNHIAFDEATAILAGDALLILAFELLGRSPHGGLLCAELARAVGSQGVIGGQAEDLASEGKPPDAEMIDYIHRNKTAALIRASCVLGGLCAETDSKTLEKLADYGEQIGLAFQLADDLLDECSTVEELGKDIGSDKANDKMTYLSVHGESKTKTDAQNLVQKAKESIQELPCNVDILSSLADSILKKIPMS